MRAIFRPGDDRRLSWRRRRIFLGVLLAVLLRFQDVQAADPDRSRNRETGNAWLPGIGLLLGVDSQQGDADASSSARGDLNGDGLLLTPLIGIEAEVLSPPLARTYGRPRVFVRGGVTRAFSVERTIVKEGSPGTIDIPIIDPDQDGDPDQRTPIAAVGGRGTRFQTEVQPWGFMAGVGLAFEVPISNDRSRTVRIKPSFEYRRERFQASAFLGEAQSLDESELCPCRSSNFSISAKQTLHAIGPGLEIEMDASRRRSTIVTLYGAFRAYHAIDGRSLGLEGASRFDDETPVSLEGRFDRDPWSFRFGLGIRLRWNPS